MIRKILLVLVSAACLSIHASALEKSVATAAEFTAALTNAKPGDTIILENGNWKDLTLKLNIRGAADAPITVRAETPGKVVLTGASSLSFEAPFVTVDGLLFADGNAKGGFSVVQFQADHCRLTNSAIVNFNPPDVNDAYYWVYFNGNYNRLDHCYFTGKNNQNPLIGNDRTDSCYNRVDDCYFTNIPFIPNRNGREIFRVWGTGGNEELGDDGAYFTIDHNLFEHADGEGMEIISLKSNHNRVLHNTIRDTIGGITMRSGNYNTIEGNFIFGGGRKGEYGMRVTGRYHVIANNYIANCDYGLDFYAGEYIDKDLTGKWKPILREGTPLGRVPFYSWPRWDAVVHNTFVNNTGFDIHIGGGYKSAWPSKQRILMPAENLIANNLIVKTNGGAAITGLAPDSERPLDIFSFKPNLFRGNIVHGGTVTYDQAKNGWTDADPKLAPAADDVYRPAKDSPVIDAGKEEGSPTISDDFDGQPRSGIPDVGGDEVSGAPVREKPLTAADVGPDWVKVARQSGDARFK